jgi:predicted nucleic acid-binding protein
LSEFVDANIFIRLITADDPAKSSRCLELFKRAERGEAQLVTSEAIVAEVIYVLSSPALYRLGRPDIAARLRPLLELRGLQLDHKRSLLLALDLYEKSKLDFEDCIAIRHAERLELAGILSFDRGLDRFSNLRIEP